MTKRSYSAAELVGLPGMPPRSERSIYLFEEKRGMVRVPGARPARWFEDSLPPETRAALQAAHDAAEKAAPDPAGHGAGREASREQGKPRGASRIPAGPGAERADAKQDILAAFERWRRTEGTSVLFDDRRRFAELYNDKSIDAGEAARSLLPTISQASLARWATRFKQDGWSGLLDARAQAPKQASLIDSDHELRDVVIAQILERPSHINCKHIMRALRVTFERDRLPAYRTLQRWVADWRVENARMISAIADPDRHRSRYLPAGGDAGAGVERLNQLWELDSTPADVLCTDGRNAIVGAIDVYSRRMKVLVVPTSKAAAVASLLRRCIMTWGVPETVRTDEGADYTSRHVRRVLADLGCRHDVLPPYSPQRKPFIERGLGSLSRVLELLPGFAGHSVAEAQALRSRKSFAQRRGEGDAEAFQVALTAHELQAACDRWLDNVYEREPHEGLGGKTPFEMAAGQPVRRIADERALDLLLAEPAEGGGWRTVQKKGLYAEGTIFIAAELGALVGERVQVRLDPADSGVVYVFDAEGAFVTRAVAPEREGIDRAEVAAKMKAQARDADREARAFARELKRRVNPSTAIDQILGRATTEAATVVAFPSPAETHDSPGLAAAADAAAADAPPAGPSVITDEMREARRLEREAIEEEERQAEIDRRRRMAEARRRAAEDLDDEPVPAVAGKRLDEWFKRGG